MGGPLWPVSLRSEHPSLWSTTALLLIPACTSWPKLLLLYLIPLMDPVMGT